MAGWYRVKQMIRSFYYDDFGMFAIIFFSSLESGYAGPQSSLGSEHTVDHAMSSRRDAHSLSMV